MASLIRSRALALTAWAIFAAGAPAIAQSHNVAPPFAQEPDNDFSGDPHLELDDDTEFQDDYSDDFIETDLDTLEQAHSDYLRNGSFQLSRPEQEDIQVEPSEPPGWLRGFFKFFEAMGPLFQVIFWIVIVAVLAGILYFIYGEAIRMRLGFKRTPKASPADDILTDIRPDAARARSLLEEADALAREGRFAEAVHLLLFRSIEDIQERLDGGVPSSLTAREIAGLGKLPDRAKRALQPIISIVERSFFGGRDVDSEGWSSARRSYEDFAFGEGWA